MSDEYKEELQKEEIPVSEKLDSPLVVHKKSDASYEESALSVEMNETHTEEDKPTLSRHRFKKEKKSKAPYITILVIIIVLAVAFAALYYTGNITFTDRETTTAKPKQTTEITTSLEERYEGTIVVKDMYIFVNGEEVDGISGLQEALRYEDASPTAFRIIREGANSDYLNFEILPVLENMGFYDENTEITIVDSTGLIAEAETTTLPPETTTTTTTTTENGE